MTTKEFQKLIWQYYKKNGRKFPWRETANPYRILVSEIMLQQTQTDRVVPKYKSFLKKFPSVASLAKASTKDVLLEWQGLGYNRRALNLKKAAEIISCDFGSKFPKTLESLDSLPGIGPYTAGALLAFIYNKPSAFIETNIRTVYLHFFFTRKKAVHDKDILKKIEETLDQKNPKEFYYALMDYGVFLKKHYGSTNLNHKSLHYRAQSPFKGSHREQRSKILQLILKGRKIPASAKPIVEELTKEGFLR